MGNSDRPQFPTRYFVLYFGCTLDFTLRSCPFCCHDGQGCDERSFPRTNAVDHYAIAIDEFDRESVTQTLTQLGLIPEQNLDYGFYVRDPEGIPVQIVGT